MFTSKIISTTVKKDALTSEFETIADAIQKLIRIMKKLHISSSRGA